MIATVRRASISVAALLATALLSLAWSVAGAGAQTSSSDDAIVVISGDVAVERGQVVDGIFVAHGDVRIAGRVDGDVAVASGDVRVTGVVDGDLTAFSGTARLLPGAVVTGDLAYGDEQPVVARRATVEGDVSKQNISDALDIAPIVSAFAFWLATAISGLVLGLLLLLLAPRAADAAFAQAQTRFGTVIGLGFAVLFGLPILGIVAAVTLVGLPLAIGVFLAWLPLASVAFVTSGWAIGRAIVKPPTSRYLAFLAGFAILQLTTLIPVIGGVAWLAAVIVGFGMLAGAITAARKSHPPGSPAPAAAGPPSP